MYGLLGLKTGFVVQGHIYNACRKCEDLYLSCLDTNDPWHDPSEFSLNGDSDLRKTEVKSQ